MNRNEYRKARISEHRKRVPIIIMNFEGENKTENLYFKNFRKRESNFQITYVPGNETDIKSLISQTIKFQKRNSFNYDEGDRAYVFVDVDDSEQKYKTIIKNIKLANDNNIEVILSNPCFEVWFLFHFVYTTAKMNNKNLMYELKKYIPDYKKEENVFLCIEKNTIVGIKNCEKLKKYHASNTDIYLNPYTDVDKVVKILMK